MRVALHAGQLLRTAPGGIGTYVRALLRHLPAAGVDVVAVADGPAPADLHPATPWVDLGPPRGGVRAELWQRLRRPALRVPGGFDLVHAPSLAVPPAGGRPLVVSIHDVAFLEHPEITTRRGRSFHRRGLELVRREATAVIAPSEYTRGALARAGIPMERVHLVPLGVDPALPRDADDARAAVAALGVTEPYVLAVGTLEPRKNFGVLVEAMARVVTAAPALSLVIAGPPGWGDAGDLDRAFVRLVGRQPDDVVDALYRRAAVCAVPSKVEGFGLPALEAMSRGCPVVANAGSAVEEVVGDAGVLVDASDTDALAAALLGVLEDRERRAHLAARAARVVTHFSWTRSAALHAEVYRAALGSASAHP